MITHPHKDENGQTVNIRNPHTPSHESTWHDPKATATFTPNSSVPDHLKSKSEHSGMALGEPEYHQVNGLHTASGSVVVEPDHRVWLVSPTNAFGGYRYTFPKGTAEPGHSLQHTAMKETHEESGMHVELTHHLGDYERSTSKARMYVAKRIGGSPADMGWESQAAHLVPMKDLHNYVHSAVDHKIVDDLHRHFAKHMAMESVKAMFKSI